MSQDSKGSPAPDVAPEEAVSSEQVADYLRRNPDFLARNPDVLSSLTPPERWSDDAVVDIQRYMVEVLREEMDSLRDCVQDVIETSRCNMSNQTRTHAAVLAVLTATNFEHLVRVISDDLTVLLDVDVAVLAFEPGLGGYVNGAEVHGLEASAVDRLLGTDQDVTLVGDMVDDGTIFAQGAGLVRSAAMVRLQPGPPIPVGLLSLGSRRPDTFRPGQGTELLRFLARVTERCLQRIVEAD